MAELIDWVFLTVFARYLRKMAAPTLNLAWVYGVSETASFLIPPTTAAVFAVIVSVYLFIGSGTPADHMSLGKATTVAAWLATACLPQAGFTNTYGIHLVCLRRNPPETGVSSCGFG
jgi:hypothetical protein